MYTFTRRREKRIRKELSRGPAASSTASEDGAHPRPRALQAATAAFCTSSNESLPLTQNTTAKRQEPSRNAQPITLSIALWRPTSSRARQARRPVEQARRVEAAPDRECSLPRSRSGSEATSGGHTQPASTSAASTATASSAPLPQTPQEDEV